MTIAPVPAEPPYRQIAAELRAGIIAGDLRPGDRVPSVRQIAQRWGVAIATANRVMAVLRDEGLVVTRVGSGTVVNDRSTTDTAPATTSPLPAGPAPRPIRRGLLPPALNLAAIRRTAVGIADREGLQSVTMRRVAAELNVGPMSLYRHVATKEDLLLQMIESITEPADLPAHISGDWRADLELVARRQWDLYRRHLWAARAISFTRPLLAPGLAAYTEWTLRALDGLGLPPRTRAREALTLHTLVNTAALAVAAESEAEQETGVSLDHWHRAQRHQTADLLTTNDFPHLAAVPEDAFTDLEALFEYSLARHLDGFAALLAGPTPPAEFPQPTR
ncbi:TetR/AcrR family transcriptional regulator C-terminal domain-containing protein [Glycomyces dulcitolivorans]|uniref:TetR/AcrR family transcriptional regulator C-terminal domain-containing protein n=1 Tax=Glycomyces dulcitolivorans TaxID=2200759 RepID=UPI000DD3FEE6|nr:GntR family transcriptional regulator [Glycomyces dulcitolivorans]